MITDKNNPIELQQPKKAAAAQLIVILGPTASGKTSLAVSLAQQLQGAILSADSRQVYRSMNIGTGKDLAEYQEIPYFLIDICDPGEKYNIARFQADFFEVYEQLKEQGKQPILCGGTGLYIQAILQGAKYSQVPINEPLRAQLSELDRPSLQALLAGKTIPEDLKIDSSTSKRLIRGLEIIAYLEAYGDSFKQNPAPIQDALIIGLNPALSLRREKISTRLKERLAAGMLQEVEELLAGGVSHAELIYYGLEYKYCSLFLQGLINYDAFYAKLEVEIHRYAKRQMTYFRKMEKDGIVINWLSAEEASPRLAEALALIKKGIT